MHSHMHEAPKSSVSWPEGFWNEGLWSHVMDETVVVAAQRQNVGKVVWVLRLLFSRG